MLTGIRHFLFYERAVLWGRLFYLKWFLKRRKNRVKYNSKLRRIVHLNTEDFGGGAAKIASDLSHYQNGLGLSAKLLVADKKVSNQSSEMIEKDASRRQHFLEYAEKRLQWQDFFHLSSFRIHQNYLVRLADIVHLHNLHGNYFSYLALPLLSNEKPVVWTLHDMHGITGHCSHSFSCERWQTGCGKCPDLSCYPKLTKDTTAFIYKAKQVAYAKSILHVVVPSQWLMEKVKNSILKNHNIHLIYNGVDTSVYRPKETANLRRRLEISPGKKIVLFSANLGVVNPFKGGEYLNRLVSEFANNESILFIAVGNSSSLHYSHKNLLNVPFLSSACEMADYYNLADVYLYPSLADNCPLAVLESMGCGTPVLAFDTGGTAELVLHGETGYIARYRDLADLKHGLDTLLSDSEALKEMSIAGVNRVQSHFTIEIMNEQYMQLYYSILDSSNQSSV